MNSDMIGGAFGFELSVRGGGFPFQESANCAWLNSGRAALECILRSMPRLPERAFIPSYTCDTVLTVFRRLGIPVLRYEVEPKFLWNAQELHFPERPGAGDLLLLTNYFGLGDASALLSAVQAHPGSCILDCATALYAPPIPGVPAFYSLRKFAGVPDGGVAVAPFSLTFPEREDDSSIRAQALLERSLHGAVASLPHFERLERGLSDLPMMRMSPLTRAFIAAMDWASIAAHRTENYRILHERLREFNRLALPPQPPSAPFCYPLLTGIPGLRDELIDAGIALPVLWEEVIARTQAADPSNVIARSLLPLPLDQRYSASSILARLNLGL